MNERIKKIRKDNGLTQEEFAVRLGIKRNTVATYEMGRSEPSNSALSLICREFNINENWLRTGEGEPYVQLESNDVITRTAVLLGRKDPFLEAFLEVYSKMSDSARAIMVDALEEIFEIYKSKKE